MSPVTDSQHGGIAKPVVWSVAASDNSGGAGIQADILAIHAFGGHACTVVTAITAQNSQALQKINLPLSDVQAQWHSLLQEYPPKAVKLGMVGAMVAAVWVGTRLRQIDAVVVCDPVLRSSSGVDVTEGDHPYHTLWPVIDILTPNVAEFCRLFNVNPASPDELFKRARNVQRELGLDFIITGGEQGWWARQASDFCLLDGRVFWLHSPVVDTANTHGTGCTFSSAMAAALACGYDRLDAVVLAKAYVNQGLRQAADFPHLPEGGMGPVQQTSFPTRLDCLPMVTRKLPWPGEMPHYSFPRIDTSNLGLYAVVDSLAWIEHCLEQGIKTVQLRVKDIPADELDAIIAKAVALGRHYNARLFINDYWQLAIKHHAYGVHLGQEDLDTADLEAIAAAGLHLGVSTHSWFEIARAHSLRPSYIAIGPIFATTTKVMRFAPQGITQLQQWVDLLANDYPLVAIGGIDATNADAVLATGVGSIAVVRAITQAEDVPGAIRGLQASVAAARGQA